ncbi:MAG TPA: ABC transporter permease [Vicinamibacterales bacterium]|nr:ABC transporter permease [Vicinamibacterales bacterium]
MRSVLARLRAFWRGLRRPSQLDADMQDEMRFHIEMETTRLMRRGLSAHEAARQAAVAFGGVEKYRGAGRDVLGLTWVRGLSTDFKLGGRMLAKYPGLTAVALFALSLAIGAGAAYLEFSSTLMHGTLPFADAGRIVGIQLRDRETRELEKRVSADYVAWRDSMRSIEALAAYRELDRNLITDDGRAEPVRGAQITASAFTIAQVPPLLGRVLQPADERPGAAPVAVIGHDIWTTRFASDAAVLGRAIRIGANSYTIVGVMPEGFGLPVHHSLWIPLGFNDAYYPRRSGPPTGVLGKLARGVTLQSAQAELDALALRAAADSPQTHAHLYTTVKPYVESLWAGVDDSSLQTIGLYAFNLFFIGLLALCGANVATLVFARTAMRETEISVRTALGASRCRITGQLFVEALVLSSTAAVIGLTFASATLTWVRNVVTSGMDEPIWFWWRDDLAWQTIAYAGLLAVLAALIVGVVPALKATGVRIQDRLKQATGATSGALKFGGVWTVVIVTQVAVTVIFFAIVGMIGWSAYVTGGGKRPLNVPAGEYVTARLTLDRDAVRDAAATDDQERAEYRRQLRSSYQELSRRLATEPLIKSVTYGTRLPGTNPEFELMNVDGVPPPPSDQVFDVRTVGVGLNYFEAFKAPIVAGRNFSEGDLSPGRHVAIVDRTFARRAFNGQDAVGRLVRRAAGEQTAAGPWVEIVGVVADLTDDTNKQPGEAVLYEPVSPDAAVPFFLAVHARANVESATARLRLVAAEVDPMLRLDKVLTLDRLSDSDRVALDFFARLMAGICVVAIILATAGVYALMSFTVSRRTAEIGIRVALGARPGRVVWNTFSRALAQVTVGLVAGSVPAAFLVWTIGPEVSATNGSQVALWTGVVSTLIVAIMAAVACIGPARRALRMQPTDALKST